MSTEPSYTTNDEKSKSEAIIALVTVSILVFIIVGYFIYTKWWGREKTIFNRIKQFYGSSLSRISLTVIIAFLASDVISGFNSYIMTPLVQSLFPGQTEFSSAVPLPRNIFMFPGKFLQAFIGFILSILFLFIVAEMVARLIGFIGKNRSWRTYEIFTYIAIFIIIAIMIIWNIYELFVPPEPTTPDQMDTQQLRNVIRKVQTPQLANLW